MLHWELQTANQKHGYKRTYFVVFVLSEKERINSDILEETMVEEVD